MDIKAKSLKKHYGRIDVVSKVKATITEEFSLAYTPGVAEPCLEIHKDISKFYELTRRNNLVAVISDGTAVLAFGDIGL